MNKKVVLVTNTSWYAYNFYKELICFYIENNIDVYIVSPEEEYFSDLKNIGAKCTRIYFSRRGFNLFEDFCFVFNLMLFYIKIKPDMVYNFTIKPNVWSGFVCGILKIPYVNTISGLGSSFISGGFIRRITFVLYKLGCNRAVDNIVMNEEDFIEMKRIIGAKKSQLHKIPGTGIDLKYFNYCEPIISRKIKFLFVGRILRDKGVVELIEAFLLLDNPELVLDIVGDFDIGNPTSISQKEFKEKISKDNRIIYHGYQKDIRKFIQNTNFVLLPSYREGLPRVLMESLSVGRPILGSDVAGCRDLIQVETGFIFDCMSPESLADCIIKASCLKKSDYLSLCLSARKYAENELDLKKVMNHYYCYLKE
ncbi:glycosyltransferase family 4 protein [Aliivibrio logei]|uniref:Glycosyl transferase family 1 n=1 Tax=Aliivibrio logei 5S-186 TaxID=626086 RepID=A0ABX3ASS5_ALILO|nr:glycosyltransferase family 4 protein [Aliivibrio logei]OEF10070.1 hypothetical protein A1Q5_14030 [Aliivibrio logei 5S-186]